MVAGDKGRSQALEGFLLGCNVGQDQVTVQKRFCWAAEFQKSKCSFCLAEKVAFQGIRNAAYLGHGVKMSRMYDCVSGVGAIS